ncbi:hypothetical protein JX265_011634 [Neoarthrinium moseri]|uniref:FAD-binding domain-containing protein n=1 Tax=Neoarthrinium moseri TaxID=1658444 RepID=A0A9Q0AKI3_9PEZI|nr:hypothetical protein JX265_011634 [Neoarthrinium moseri]
MAGEEFARLYSWGHDPQRKGDYETASPCNPADVPQTLLEPILIKYATNHGFKVRFNTAFVNFDYSDDLKPITATLSDSLTGQEYQIKAKYLFGADGAQSRVVKQLGLPLKCKPGQGVAINVLVKADLSHLVETRMGNLHWVMQPDRDHPEHGWMCIVRMVKPWHEWMFILLPDPKADLTMRPTNADYEKRVREIIGDDTPTEILGVSRWYINEIVAERYSDGNIHERQPVGESIVTRANQSFRNHSKVWDSMGATKSDLAERQSCFGELTEPGEEGFRRRQAFQKAIKGTMEEFHALGTEMGQRYTGAGVFTADELRPFELTGRASKNPSLYYEPNTYPGSRLPHVWLNKAVPTTATSTIDIAGRGNFVLLTGIGGDAWKEAARRISSDLNVPLEAHSIGFRQDWEDFYFEWERLRGVEESGAVLIRPDRVVAWRAEKVMGDVEECLQKLQAVLISILHLT